MVLQRMVAIERDGLSLTAGVTMPESPRAVVVLLHGIPSVAPKDPGDEGYPGLARWFSGEGFAAVWADLRGARGAPGYFSIEGWVADAMSLISATRSWDGFESLPLAVVGSSAGGAVAVEALARGAPIDALVLLAAPATWLSFAIDAHAGVKRIVEEAGMPVSDETLADPGVWAAEFDGVIPLQSIGAATVPTLIVHGTADEVVPVEHARMLAHRAPHAEVAILEDKPHQLRRDPLAMETVRDFLRRVLT